MKVYWQKKPLLVRGAIPAFEITPDLQSPISAQELINLASDELVESRCILQSPWRLKQGPQTKRSIPALSKKKLDPTCPRPRSKTPQRSCCFILVSLYS